MDCLRSGKDKYVCQNNIRSRAHRITTETVIKKALNGDDDKRVICGWTLASKVKILMGPGYTIKMERDLLRLRTVYVLYHVDDPELKGDLHLGSTAQVLKKRLCCHIKDTARRDCATPKVYRKMLETGPTNWKIRPLACAICTAGKSRF